MTITIARRSLQSLVGAAAVLLLVCGNPVGAQQAPSAPGAGTVQGPALGHTTTLGPLVPSGPGRSALPLADPDQFGNAEKRAPQSVPTGTPGVSSSSEKPSVTKESDVPSAYGTSTAPYTTARVAVGVLGNSGNAANTPVASYPYRATGKLYFKKSNGLTYVCSASLIKKGVLVTAAHCVFDYGQTTAGWHMNYVWCPANTTSAGGVYGCYSAGSARIPSPYYSGTDTCTQAGVVCNNDLATLLVSPKSGKYAGTVVGWYSYGWNGYSYRASTFLGNVTTVQISQLGYPVALDGGYQMERTDAVGWYYTSGNLKNTQIGSAQTGGSSGGPWLVNLGTRPSVSSGASLGSFQVQAVVGVTSYGSTTVGYNRQGASYFGQNLQYPNAAYGIYGAGNIGRLVQDTCNTNPAFC